MQELGPWGDQRCLWARVPPCGGQGDVKQVPTVDGHGPALWGHGGNSWIGSPHRGGSNSWTRITLGQGDDSWIGIPRGVTTAGLE